MAGGTEARFNLSQKVLNSYTSLKFCVWYVIADSVPGYNINSTCVKKIKAMSSKTIRLRGTDELLLAALEVDPTGAARYGAKPTEESQQQCS